MLETVVMCLLTHFCLRLWAELKRRFESWDTETEEIGIYKRDEVEGSETDEGIDDRLKASRGMRDKLIRLNLGSITKYRTKEENEKQHPASNLSGNKEPYLSQRKWTRDIDAQDPREKIISLIHEIDKANEAARACYRNFIWANQEGMKGKQTLFIAYVAIKRKMTHMENQLAELQRNVEGEICTDESCVMNKENSFQGRDIQKYSGTSCRKWHTQRKTGLEMGTRPRDSRLRLCPRDYSCTNKSCTAWHQRDAKFCSTPWAPCLTWHGGKCKAKMPVEEQQTPIVKEEKERFICINDIGTCLDPECTKFHYTGMWINTSPKGWIEKATGRSQVPLLTMIPLCINGRSTTKTPCLKQDCLDRHQYPNTVSLELHETPKEHQIEKKQSEWFRILNRTMEKGAAELTESSGTSSYMDYKPEAKDTKRDEEIKPEARRIERPNEVARLQAGLSSNNTKDVKDNSAVDKKKEEQLHVTTLSSDNSKEKRKSAEDCAKAKDGEECRKTFLEDGTTYLNNVCRKMAADQETRDAEMKSIVEHFRTLLTDGNGSGDSSKYQTQRQQERSKRAQKLARKTLRAQKVKEAKETERLRIEHEKTGENKDEIDAEKDKIAPTQENHDVLHMKPEEVNETNHPVRDATLSTTTEGYQPSIVKKRGPAIVLDDYKQNFDRRTFTEEPVYWQSVLDTFGEDPKTGLKIIPPVVKRTLYEVEDPKGKIIEAFRDNIRGSKDQHHVIFETARMMIKLGIDHHLLPIIYSDYLMPWHERKVLESNPEIRRSLTALLDYTRKKHHPMAKMGKAVAKAIRYYAKELKQEGTCLTTATRTLKEIYARGIVMSQATYSQLSSGEREFLQESLVKGIMENELKVYYEETWNKALEMGITHYPAEKLAEKVRDIFKLSKEKRYGTATIEQEAKDAVTGSSENKDMENLKKGENEQDEWNENPSSSREPLEENLRTTSPEGHHCDQSQKVTYIEGNPWECLYHITDEGRRLPIMYYETKETDCDQSRKSTSTGGNLGEFLWSSANGTVKNVKLPCRYHKDQGITATECMSRPGHCYECSEPGHLAPPIRRCKGKHKWKPMNRSERKRR